MASSGRSSGAGAEKARLVKSDVLKSDKFGDCAFNIYEACTAEQEGQPPVLLVWLHGHTCEHTPAHQVEMMHRRLGRRIIFFAPVNPVPKDGWLSAWGVNFTRKQNKHDLGHVHGEMNCDFLSALCDKIREVRDEAGSSKVLLFGYSMGGFGAWQLAGFMPELFTAIIPIAGYGQGTLEPHEKTWAPQPLGTQVHHRFVERYREKWAQVPLVLAVHAENDRVSSFRDTESIVSAVCAAGGNAELIAVPKQGVKGKSGHDYYKYTLQADTSEEVVYSRLRPLLDDVPEARLEARAKAHARWEPRAKAKQHGVRKWWWTK